MKSTKKAALFRHSNPSFLFFFLKLNEKKKKEKKCVPFFFFECMQHTKKKSKIILLFLFGVVLFVGIAYLSYFIVLKCAVHGDNDWFNVGENEINDIQASRWPLTIERFESDVLKILEMDPKVQLNVGDRVFEVGCGTGAFLDVMLKIFPEVEVYGNDVNKSAIQRCQRKHKPENFMLGDMCDIEINGQFDCIIGNCVLGYMLDHKTIYKTLEKCDTHLKSGKTMRFTALDYPCTAERFLSFRCAASSMRTSVPQSLFQKFAKIFNYEVHFSDETVMNGQDGRRYSVVLKKNNAMR